MSITIDQLMEQALVYASAWSLIDGPFDQGNQLEQAGLEKQVLLEMLVAFEDQAHTAGAQEAQLDLAKPLIEWHQQRIGNISTLEQAVEDTQICLGVDDANPIILRGEMLKGWRFALAIAKQQFEKFPLSIQRTAPTSDEEE
ncbi:host nuclease inhibitor protein [Ectopseudomonas khazarica]|uniref:host nuclease inhibitor protein n=1 Tax=Ectopseudomonas khazarica TaxID=2502979 RepID=UPI003B951AA5